MKSKAVNHHTKLAIYIAILPIGYIARYLYHINWCKLRNTRENYFFSILLRFINLQMSTNIWIWRLPCTISQPKLGKFSDLIILLLPFFFVLPGFETQVLVSDIPIDNQYSNPALSCLYMYKPLDLRVIRSTTDRMSWASGQGRQLSTTGKSCHLHFFSHCKVFKSGFVHELQKPWPLYYRLSELSVTVKKIISEN